MKRVQQCPSIFKVAFFLMLVFCTFNTANAQEDDAIFEAIKKQLTRDKDFSVEDSTEISPQKLNAYNKANNRNAKTEKELKKEERANRKAEKIKEKYKLKLARADSIKQKKQTEKTAKERAKEMATGTIKITPKQKKQPKLPKSKQVKVKQKKKENKVVKTPKSKVETTKPIQKNKPKAKEKKVVKTPKSKPEQQKNNTERLLDLTKEEKALQKQLRKQQQEAKKQKVKKENNVTIKTKGSTVEDQLQLNKERLMEARIDSLKKANGEVRKKERRMKRLANMTDEQRQKYFDKQARKQTATAGIDSIKQQNIAISKNRENIKKNTGIRYFDKDGNLLPIIDTIEVRSPGYAGLDKQTKQKFKFNFERGLMKISLEDHKDALKYLEKCLDMTPNNEEVLQLRGNTFVALKKYKSAKKDFEFALTKKQNDAVLHYNYAITNSKMGNFKKAIEAYNKAIELKPDYMLAYQGRATAKTMTGDFEGSLKDYNKAIEINAYFTSAYKGRGVSKCLMGDYQNAIFDFSMVLEFKPNDGLSYYYRGLAYHGLDNFFKGCTDLSRAQDMGIYAASDQMRTLCK